MTERIPRHEQRQALELQLAAIAGREPPGGLFEVRYKLPGRRGMGQLFHDCHRRQAILDTIGQLARRTDVYIGCAPRRDPHGTRDAIQNIWCLWADCDGPDAVDRLMAFRPLPAIIIGSGSPNSVHAWWPLREPLRPGGAEGGNRRLAAHLGADPKATDAARILRPAGTLNHKHDPPGAVECVRLEIEPRLPTALDVLANVPALHEPEPITHLRARMPRSAFGDPLMAIPAAEYVPILTGNPVGRDGKATCPFHGGGQERTPSLHAYPDAEQGWACFGSCPAPSGKKHFGGDIYTFGAVLYGLDPHRDFPEIRRRLAADLLREVAA
jgi:hypothetical protein